MAHPSTSRADSISRRTQTFRLCSSGLLRATCGHHLQSKPALANFCLSARGCRVRAWARGARRARQAHITDETQALFVAPTCQTDERVAEKLHGDQTHPDIRQRRRSPSLICCDNDLCIPRFRCSLQPTKGHTKRRSIQRDRSAKHTKPTWLKQGVVKVMNELFTY